MSGASLAVVCLILKFSMSNVNLFCNLSFSFFLLIMKIRKGFFPSSLRQFLCTWMPLPCFSSLQTPKNSRSPVLSTKSWFLNLQLFLTIFSTFSTLCLKHKGYSTEITNYILHMTVKICKCLKYKSLFYECMKLAIHILHANLKKNRLLASSPNYFFTGYFYRLLSSSPNYFCSELPPKCWLFVYITT